MTGIKIFHVNEVCFHKQFPPASQQVSLKVFWDVVFKKTIFIYPFLLLLGGVGRGVLSIAETRDVNNSEVWISLL